MENCGMNVAKYILFIFNLIFAISGIGIIAAGACVLANSSEFEYFSDSGNTFGPAIVLIVVGSIVFIIAFFGCFGAIRESYCMLMTFAVFLLIIFIVELAAGIAAAVNKIELSADKLKGSLSRYSTNTQDKNAWDAIQTNLMCCGIEGNGDWGSSPPYSCCRSTPENADSQVSEYCQTNDKRYISTVGCLNKLKDGYNKNSKVIIGVGIGIAFIELIGIILACWLAAAIKRETQSDPEK